MIETLLMPSAQALQKRFDITFVPEDYCPDSTYESIAFPLVDVREGKDVKAALSVL